MADDLIQRLTDDEWRKLIEKDDRTSPEEYPDMALITREELRAILEAAALTRLTAGEPVGWEYEFFGGQAIMPRWARRVGPADPRGVWGETLVRNVRPLFAAPPRTYEDGVRDAAKVIEPLGHIDPPTSRDEYGIFESGNLRAKRAHEAILALLVSP